MSADNVVGLVLAVAVLAYLVYACSRPRSWDERAQMSWQNWLAALVGLIVVTTRLLGPYLARVLDGGSAPGDRVFLPATACSCRSSE